MPPACHDPRPSDGFWYRTLPGNGPAPDRPPLFCPGCVLMRPHAGAIHVMDFPINLPNGISFPLHLSQKPLPQALLPPPVETAGYRGPGTKAPGQIPPRGAGAQNPQYPVDDRAMVTSRSSCCRLLCRQQRCQSLPLLLTQVPASHYPSPFLSSSPLPYIIPVALQTRPRIESRYERNKGDS